MPSNSHVSPTFLNKLEVEIGKLKEEKDVLKQRIQQSEKDYEDMQTEVDSTNSAIARLHAQMPIIQSLLKSMSAESLSVIQVFLTMERLPPQSIHPDDGRESTAGGLCAPTSISNQRTEFSAFMGGISSQSPGFHSQKPYGVDHADFPDFPAVNLSTPNNSNVQIITGFDPTHSFSPSSSKITENSGNRDVTARPWSGIDVCDDRQTTMSAMGSLYEFPTRKASPPKIQDIFIGDRSNFMRHAFDELNIPSDPRLAAGRDESNKPIRMIVDAGGSQPRPFVVRPTPLRVHPLDAQGKIGGARRDNPLKRRRSHSTAPLHRNSTRGEIAILPIPCQIPLEMAGPWAFDINELARCEMLHSLGVGGLPFSSYPQVSNADEMEGSLDYW
ncbi:hypothetical protein GALMADRAFT_276738 [Galerina marginata CBS 339.88]|uniref:Uncharacterized protein n=1 Tax=Galerina marginata (strain CBS 339.88) TaxID=685588 RepID=A0A067TIJ2_GALM3|nr:hypothetical protein GALMADRAFT_276738 [Galerina marginata CBS 339.88]